MRGEGLPSRHAVEKKGWTLRVESWGLPAIPSDAGGARGADGADCADGAEGATCAERGNGADGSGGTGTGVWPRLVDGPFMR